MTSNNLLVLVFFISFTTIQLSAQTSIYVDSSSTALIPDGLSWSTAFDSLQHAINVASEGDTIWVAKGTYTPSVDTAGTASPKDLR